MMKNNVKEHRKRNLFTQETLAEAMGVSRQTINAIEKGKYAPSTILALKMADLLKTNVEELFQLEETDWDSK